MAGVNWSVSRGSSPRDTEPLDSCNREGASVSSGKKLKRGEVYYLPNAPRLLTVSELLSAWNKTGHLPARPGLGFNRLLSFLSPRHSGGTPFRNQDSGEGRGAEVMKSVSILNF